MANLAYPCSVFFKRKLIENYSSLLFPLFTCFSHEWAKCRIRAVEYGWRRNLVYEPLHPSPVDELVIMKWFLLKIITHYKICNQYNLLMPGRHDHAQLANEMYRNNWYLQLVYLWECRIGRIGWQILEPAWPHWLIRQTISLAYLECQCF